MSLLTISIAVFLCIVSVVGSEQKLPADLGIYSSAAPQSRFLNPFNWFGNPDCEYDGDQGTCYGEVACLALAGSFGNFCSGLHGLCCLFYRTCGMRTSQKYAHFRNIQYPARDNAQEDCSFQVVRRSEDYCGLRVQMTEADLPNPTRLGSCPTAFEITGLKNKRINPQCGKLSGRSYDYDIRESEEVVLHIKSAESEKINFNIRVEQIHCRDFAGENTDGLVIGSGGDADGGAGSAGGGSGSGSGGSGSGGSGSGGSGGGSPTGPDGGTGGTGSGGGVGGEPQPPAPPPPTQPPTITAAPTQPPPPPPTQPPSLQRCGVRGSPFDQGPRGGDSAMKREARRWREQGPYTDYDEYTFPPGVTTRRRNRPKRRRGSNKRRRGGQREGQQERQGQIPGSVPSSSLRPIKGSVQTRPLIGNIVSQRPAVSTQEWGVPANDDSLFAHYAGKRGLFDSRVTYGTVTGIREFPWQVAMTVNGRFHCGGSVLGTRHVLTAAHCVKAYRNSPRSVKLSLGDWDLSTTSDGPSIDMTAEKITVHSGYSQSTLQNDIAIIRTSQDIVFTDDVMPACIPDSDLDLDGMNATVTGWGRNQDGKLQTQLHKVTAEILPNSICDEKWNAKGAAKGFIVRSMMCMNSLMGDSCNGDSGGPSVIASSDGYGTYQVGIVSFGSGSCTDPDLPGVYTRVSFYRQWIKNNMN